MKAIIMDRGRTIQGLGDPAAEALFAWGTVREAVDAACMASGLEPVRVVEGAPVPVAPDEPVLVLPSDLVVTSTVLEGMLRKGLGTGTRRLALRRTPAVDYALPLQDVPVEPLTEEERRGAPPGRLAARERSATEKVLLDGYLATGKELGGGPGVFGRLALSSAPLVVDKKELVIDVKLPLLPLQSSQPPVLAYPVTSSVAVQVRHWTHVLWLNHLAPGVTLNLALRQRWLWALWRVATGGSLERSRVLERLSVIHPTAKVHPTAYVEASVIGPGAVVGVRASVRESFVAEGAEVGDHATVLMTTVGKGAYVTPKSFLVWCALYPGAVVGNHKLQVTLVGREAHVNAWVGMIDAKFQGGVRVECDGGLRDTGRSFLGSCVGHGAQLAAKVLIQPGRVIPAGAVVVMRPDEVISDVPADLQPGVPMVRDGGTLRPLAEVKSRAGCGMEAACGPVTQR